MSEAPKKDDLTTKTFHRSLSVSSIDRTRGEDDQPDTYSFRLSSTEPVEVWRNEFEILDHGKKSVRMDFLASGNAPLLWMHDRDQQLGIIESASIKGDSVEVTARFGESEFAKEKKRDVDAGILKNVSVGFRIHSWKAEESDGEKETYRVNDWEPFEGSFVTIPADKSVGIGRSASFRDLLSSGDNTERESKTEKPQSRKTTIETMSEEKDKKPDIDLEKERGQAASDALIAERKRTSSIREIASEMKIPGVDLQDLAERACGEDTSIENFRASVLEKIKDAAPKLNQADIGVSQKDQKRYSIQNVLQGLRDGNLEKVAPHELEVSEELKSRMGKAGDTIAIPHDVLLRGWVPKDDGARAIMAHNLGVSTRDLSAITLGGAGQTSTPSNLVETELLDEMFIYSLRENSAILNSGVTMINGLVGDVDIPLELLNPSFYWVAEDAEPTEGTHTLGKASLSFKTIAARVPYTRQADKQTTPGLEGILIRSLRIGASNGLASALYSGDGTGGAPTGIESTVGVGSVVGSGGYTRSLLIDLEADLGAANATGAAHTFMNSTTAATFAKTLVDAGSGQFVGNYNRADRTLLDTPIGSAHIDNLVGANTVIHGIPSSLLVGMWGTMELGIDTATKAATGGKVLRVFLDADCNVPQPATWTVIDDLP